VTPGTNANSLNATGITAYQTLSTAVQSNAIVADAVQVVLSVFTRVPKGGVVTNVGVVNYMVTRSVLGTVRRRRPGRGK
jgi:hypothetical protein